MHFFFQLLLSVVLVGPSYFVWPVFFVKVASLRTFHSICSFDRPQDSPETLQWL